MAIDPGCLRDLKRAASSATLRHDTTTIATNKHRLFAQDGQVDADLYLSFLTDFSALLNHKPRSRQPFIETEMKL
ncbi:MAG: hypothetical protein GXP09_08845 [Gammaproteobacteria bacterium]|nr:hypothetical protein [Gammaproteobacteria bacterium]